MKRVKLLMNYLFTDLRLDQDENLQDIVKY